MSAPVVRVQEAAVWWAVAQNGFEGFDRVRRGRWRSRGVGGRVKNAVGWIAAFLVLAFVITYWKWLVAAALIGGIVWSGYTFGVPWWQLRRQQEQDRRNGDTARRSALAAEPTSSISSTSPVRTAASTATSHRPRLTKQPAAPAHAGRGTPGRKGSQSPSPTHPDRPRTTRANQTHQYCSL